MANNRKGAKTMTRRASNKKKGRNKQQKKKDESFKWDENKVFTDKKDDQGYPASVFYFEIIRLSSLPPTSKIFNKLIEVGAEGSKRGCMGSMIQEVLRIKLYGQKNGRKESMTEIEQQMKLANLVVATYPLILELCIRGHTDMMYEISYMVPMNLSNYWQKMKERVTGVKLPGRRESICNAQRYCSFCGTIEEMTYYCQPVYNNGELLNGYFFQSPSHKVCTGCNFFTYCSEECQKKDLAQGHHIGHCRQQRILEEYHKPHAMMIRRRLQNGDDPKKIPELQLLREKLGLTRPKDNFYRKRYGIEYADDEVDKKHFRHVARKDGRVPVGFVTNEM